jgi:RNA ligase
VLVPLLKTLINPNPMQPTLTPEFIPFPSIGQYREAVFNTKALAIAKDLEDNGETEVATAGLEVSNKIILPTIAYTGHVKIHGTNAGLVYYPDGTFHCQSRQEIIKPGSDNAGFAAWAYPKAEQILNLSPGLINLLKDHHTAIAIYGEWCGSKISPNVALGQLGQKIFVVFAVAFKVATAGIELMWGYDKLFDFIDPTLGVYNTGLFGTYPITIDFNNPQAATEQLQQWVKAVENECPAGKYFNLTGLGEGIVFTANNPIANPLGNFKVKGTKHQAAAAIVGATDPVAIAELSSLIDLIMRTGEVETRTAQAVRVLKEQGLPMNSMQQTKELVQWLIADISKENLPDIEASAFSLKSVLAACTKAGREAYKLILDALI